METIKSRVVRILDQEFLDAVRDIIVKETKKIVQSETRKIVQEETKKIVQSEQILRALESNKDIQNARMDRMEHDLAQLLGSNKKIEDLEDRYIHHSHRIVIDTSEAVEKDAS
ncbi:MAG: Uncharacterized protein CI948_1746 [Halanaerobium sp.]|nr:MAG: Uncharacterized protein CI948_1746 [Halanaerobium sp.]